MRRAREILVMVARDLTAPGRPDTLQRREDGKNV